MSTQTCSLCGRTEQVTPDGRGFPPDIAKRRLIKRCKANGCPSSPTYMATILWGVCPPGENHDPI
jgi:hypothetical protein